MVHLSNWEMYVLECTIILTVVQKHMVHVYS